MKKYIGKYNIESTFYVFENIEEHDEFVKAKTKEGVKFQRFNFEDFNIEKDTYRTLNNCLFKVDKEWYFKVYNILEEQKQEFKELKQMKLF